MPKLYHNNRHWQVPGKQDKGAGRHDIPASPAELAAWLNARQVSPIQGRGITDVWLNEMPIVISNGPAEDEIDQARDRIRELERALHRSADRCPKCGDRPATAAAIVESQDVGAIADWILDRASATQVEQLFAALGARFHELRKEKLA